MTTTPSKTYHITGLDCANCARSVESGVANLADVTSASLNFTTGTLRVEGDISSEQIIGRVRELGYDVADSGNRIDEAASESQPDPIAPRPGLLPYLWDRPDTRLALLGAVLILPGLIFEELLGGTVVSSPIFDAMAVGAMILAGLPIARSAWRALRINHEITINLLMTIAAIGAVVIGAYTEAGLVMVLFAIGEALEATRPPAHGKASAVWQSWPRPRQLCFEKPNMVRRSRWLFRLSSWR
ncbi:MAG: cation transporter [Chloroflexota bacterium]